MEYGQIDFPLEVKDIGETGVFEGYASVFNKPIRHPFFGTDIVAPGAFAKTLRDKGPQGIKMLYQHNTDEPIGQWQSLTEDDKGLFVRGQLILDLDTARKAHILMKNKVLDGLSIGFDSSSQANTFDAKKNQRTLNEIDLYEISPVTFPAQTIAKIRNVKAVQTIENIREFEEFLREAGFSKKEATQLALKGWPPKQREVVEGHELPTALLDGVVEALREARAAIHRPTGGIRDARDGGSTS